MTVEVLVQLPDPVPETQSLALTKNPPEGYSYRFEYHRARPYYFLPFRQFDSFLYSHNRLKDAFWLAKGKLPSGSTPAKAQLIFSFLPHPTSNQLPIILHTEYAYAEGADSSQLYRHILTRSSIKKILAAGPTCARTFLSILSPSEFERLVDFVLPGITPPPPFAKEYSDTTTLLFVTSASVWARNSNWGAERSFNYRGGMDVLSSFRELNKQFGNRIRLIIRGRIPHLAKKLFHDVLKLPNVTVHEEVLSRSDFERLCLSSDIFVFPAFRGPALAIAEAFSYYLPVVGADSWDMGDFITDGVDGLTVHRDDSIRFTVKNGIPFWDYRSIAEEPSSPEFIRNYTDAIARLVDNKSLTRRLGMSARNTVEHGQFSVANMQQKMAKVFQQVLNGV